MKTYYPHGAPGGSDGSILFKKTPTPQDYALDEELTLRVRDYRVRNRLEAYR